MSAYACDPGRGSEAGNSWHWASNLSKQGHEVWVLTPDEDGACARSGDAAGIPDLHFIVVPIPARVRAKRGRIWVYVRYLSWQRTSFRRAAALHAKHSFDIVHHVSWGSLVWGSPLWRLGAPFIFGPAGGGQVAPRGYRRYFGKQWVRESLRTFVVKRILPLNPLTRRTVKNAELMLVPNSETRALVKRMGSKWAVLTPDTAVPPKYADHASTRTLEEGRDLRIIWIARLYPIKGLRLALEALASTRDVRWQLTIVGGGPLASLVPVWLDELGIEDRVEWKGQITWEEVRVAYGEAHVMLFTSLRESMGAQLVEALGTGLPVIALDHHGARDLLPDDAALKVAVGTPEETTRDLGIAIRDLVEHPDRVQQMSRAAIRFSRTLTWENKVRDTYRLIESSSEREHDV